MKGGIESFGPSLFKFFFFDGEATQLSPYFINKEWVVVHLVLSQAPIAW
jgi:hypothetical protein